jgi:hypothetical protein
MERWTSRWDQGRVGLGGVLARRWVRVSGHELEFGLVIDATYILGRRGKREGDGC